MFPPSEKVGVNVLHAPHQIAPMGAGIHHMEKFWYASPFELENLGYG